MMKKLKLSLDDIVVESFETSSEGGARGTVHGAWVAVTADDQCVPSVDGGCVPATDPSICPSVGCPPQATDPSICGVGQGPPGQNTDFANCQGGGFSFDVNQCGSNVCTA